MASPRDRGSPAEVSQPAVEGPLRRAAREWPTPAHLTGAAVLLAHGGAEDGAGLVVGPPGPPLPPPGPPPPPPPPSPPPPPPPPQLVSLFAVSGRPRLVVGRRGARTPRTSRGRRASTTPRHGVLRASRSACAQVVLAPIGHPVARKAGQCRGGAKYARIELTTRFGEGRCCRRCAPSTCAPLDLPGMPCGSRPASPARCSRRLDAGRAVASLPQRRSATRRSPVLPRCATSRLRTIATRGWSATRFQRGGAFVMPTSCGETKADLPAALPLLLRRKAGSPRSDPA